MCVTVEKVGQGRPKVKIATAASRPPIVLPYNNVLGQVVGILEPENRKAGQGVLTLFREGQGHVCYLLPNSINFTKIVPRKWVKRYVVLGTKSSQNAFFPAPFCVRSAKSAKSLQGSVPCEPTFHCKISFPSIPLCAGVIPEKVILDG